MNIELILLSGRICGQLVIMWRKSLNKSCGVVNYNDECTIRGLEVAGIAGCRNLFVNVYFAYQHSNHYDEHMDYLYKMCNVMIHYESPYV
jgi:hypothetical protein